jgi:hypothetical protein
VRRSVRQFVVALVVATVVLAAAGASLYAMYGRRAIHTVVRDRDDARTLIQRDEAYLFVPTGSTVTDLVSCDSGSFGANRILHARKDPERVKQVYERNLMDHDWRPAHGNSYDRSIRGRTFNLTVHPPDDKGDILIVAGVEPASFFLTAC